MSAKALRLANRFAARHDCRFMAKPVRLLDGSRVVWEIVGFAAGATVLLVVLTSFVGIEGQRIVAAVFLALALALGAIRFVKHRGERPTHAGVMVADQALVGLLVLGGVLLAGSVGGWAAILGIPAVVVILAGAYTGTIVRRQKLGNCPSHQE